MEMNTTKKQDSNGFAAGNGNGDGEIQMTLKALLNVELVVH